MINKESKVYKMLQGDQEELDDKKIEIRFNNLQLQFKKAYNNTKEKMYQAEEVANIMLTDALDIGTPLDEDSCFNVDDYIDASMYVVPEYQTQLENLQKKYEELFSEKLD